MNDVGQEDLLEVSTVTQYEGRTYALCDLGRHERVALALANEKTPEFVPPNADWQGK